jgi:hypothetical protein
MNLNEGRELIFHITRYDKYGETLTKKPGTKRSHGSPRLRGEDNMKMELKEICWTDVDWTQ